MMTSKHNVLSKTLTRTLPAAAAIGAILFASTTDTSSTLSPSPTPALTGTADCSQVAFVSLQSSLTEAHADYFLELAKCINSGENLITCAAELFEEYEEARNLAQEQYQAKLSVCRILGEGLYSPELDPKEFTTEITNTYWPLVRGRTLVYQKKSDEGVETIRITVDKETVEIDGIECVVVHDIVDLNGELIEDTDDWYAQHENGDVWYIGEIAFNYEEGMISDIDGSWRSGTDGAKAGILMKATPRPGDFYRQEYLINEAEDVAMVLAVGETVHVRAGTFANCVKTEDWTPLEPGVREHKYYAPGIGVVLEVKPGTNERTELIQIIDS